MTPLLEMERLAKALTEELNATDELADELGKALLHAYYHYADGEWPCATDIPAWRALLLKAGQPVD